MDRSIHEVASVEDRRTEKLAQTGEVIRERNELDQRLFREDLHAIGELPGKEIKRWNEKQPGMRKAIQHQLEGDPASIERTAPYLVY